MNESFAPKIRIEGRDYTPKGYEWILGFALAGCAWAIKEADTPEFRQRIVDDLKRQNIDNVQALIKRYENKIAALREEIE